MTMWWKLFFLLILVSSVSCGLRVVSTNSSAELPHRTGEAEVLNSSLHHYQELTLCSRFKTYHFTTNTGSFPFQVVLHLNKRLTFLACFVAVPCSVEGREDTDCTQQVKRIHSNVPGGWKQGKVFGISQTKRWSRTLSYPAWQPDTWNTVCVRVSGPASYYQAEWTTLIGPDHSRYSTLIGPDHSRYSTLIGPDHSRYSSLIGPDHSRYSTLIGGTLLCGRQGLRHNNTPQGK